MCPSPAVGFSRLSRLSIRVRHKQHFRGTLHGPLAAAIIPRGGGRTLVAGHVLQGADVGAGIAQLEYDLAPEIVRRARRNARLVVAHLEAVQQRLGGHRSALHLAALVHSRQQRAGELTPLAQLECQGSGSGRVHSSLAVALAGDCEAAGLAVVVVALDAGHIHLSIK